MLPKRFFIFGAAGAGKTTLGRALAAHLKVAHFDTDDFFWKSTDPPYQETRAIGDRRSLLHAALSGLPSWVLSGSLSQWGAPLAPFVEISIFLHLDQELRMRRLRDREIARFGSAAVSPGGNMHETSQSFIQWAADYDDGDLTIQSRRSDEAWLQTLTCPVIRISAELPTEEQLKAIAAQA